MTEFAKRDKCGCFTEKALQQQQSGKRSLCAEPLERFEAEFMSFLIVPIFGKWYYYEDMYPRKEGAPDV